MEEGRSKGLKLSSRPGFWEFHKDRLMEECVQRGGTGKGWRVEITERARPEERPPTCLR